MAAQPEYLLLLLLVLPLGALFWLAWRAGRRDRAALGDETLVGTLIHSSTRRFRMARAGLLLGAIALVVIALSRPRWGEGEETVKRSGLQIMVLLDASASMAVEDANPNRIEAAKNLIVKLLDDLDGNQVGMIVFGATSYIQFPLTSDLVAARSLVEPLNTRSLTLGGTNLAGVINDGVRALPLGQVEGRTMIIISDGGDPDEERDVEALAAAREAAAAGLTIYTIGVGSAAGGPIPYYDQFGSVEYKKDAAGVEAISALNAPLLEQIASATGGQYFAAADLDLEDLNRALSRATPVDLADQTRRLATERFYVFAGLALLLLVADVLLMRRGVV